jgi:hypothetical protein
MAPQKGETAAQVGYGLQTEVVGEHALSRRNTPDRSARADSRFKNEDPYFTVQAINSPKVPVPEVLPWTSTLSDGAY